MMVGIFGSDKRQR